MSTRYIIGIACYFLISPVLAADEASTHSDLIPLPEKMECHAGGFKLRPHTRILMDGASRETGLYLARQLGKSTGYSFESGTAQNPGGSEEAIAGAIILTTANARADLGGEGYELFVATNSIVIRASQPAGLFYGVQTLLQLFPPEILSAKPVQNVDWTAPCVQIEDQPRFPWRGLMLDVSRHFFAKEEIEKLLDVMAQRKLNIFHWHLVDDHGWRIEIKKYPRLTEVGAWRQGIGFGLDPRAGQAYDTAGRYGGFYTQNDIREVVAYAAARHITIVPEIEMPGHSLAALTAYPQFGRPGATYTIPMELGIFNGIYCPAREPTFQFLEDILTEVFQLFPGRYIHIGGDEVPKDDWKNSPECQLLMKREGLKNEDNLQSWFIQRMQTFVNAHGRTLVGWSEIAQGGLATNAVVMDWIGGGVSAARAGHEVVMTPEESCYFCYYPSLDRPDELRAYRPYLPLNRVYAFEPVPASLETPYRSRIIGTEACIWTPDIPSMSEVEQMTFPRLSALAEVAWSRGSSRNWDDFSRRLNTEYRRLTVSGINYWHDQAVQIGSWKPTQITERNITLHWDVTREITAPGRYRLSLNYTGGKNGLKIKWVSILMNGHEIARDTHEGFTGTESRRELAHGWNYFLALPVLQRGAHYVIQASVTGEFGHESSGVVFLENDANEHI